MNRIPEAGFDPSSPLLRKVFAIGAVAATFAMGHFIDVLAQGHGTSALLYAKSAPVVVAQR